MICCSGIYSGSSAVGKSAFDFVWLLLADVFSKMCMRVCCVALTGRCYRVLCCVAVLIVVVALCHSLGIYEAVVV
jgi:hypothetical protein